MRGPGREISESELDARIWGGSQIVLASQPPPTIRSLLGRAPEISCCFVAAELLSAKLARRTKGGSLQGFLSPNLLTMGNPLNRSMPLKDIQDIHGDQVEVRKFRWACEGLEIEPHPPRHRRGEGRSRPFL